MIEDRTQTHGVVGVAIAVEPHFLDGAANRRLIGQFDGDRPDRPVARQEVGHLGHASVDRVANPTLMNVDTLEGPVPPGYVAEELLWGVTLPTQGRCRQLEGGKDAAGVLRVERERRLHHRLPAFETSLRLAQELDVHQAIADLGVAGRRSRQEVDLVALLHGVRSERPETLLGHAEPRAECTPLPTRDDRRHDPPRPGGLGPATGPDCRSGAIR